MDTATMMNMLGYRIGDADTNLFTNPFRVKSLNKAQTQMAQLLHPNYLTELEALDTNNTLSNNCVLMSSLDYDVLGGAEGILAVKVYGGKYCKRISMQELKKIENTYYAGCSDNPLYYIFQNRIYVLPTATTAIDIYYLRKPTDLVYPLNADQADAGASTSKFDGRSADGLSATNDLYNNAPIFHDQTDSYHIVSDYVGADVEFTITPVASTNLLENQEFFFLLNHFDTLTKTNFNGAMSDLNPALHEIIVSFAEAYCWALNANKDRYDIALNNAKMEIEVLNSRYTKAQGIGTSEDKR